jgi:hypothetical protein
MIISVNSKMEPIPPLIKVCHVAKVLSMSRHTVHALIECGDLTAEEVNPSKQKKRRHVRVTRTSLFRFYKKRFGHTLQRALENPFES